MESSDTSNVNPVQDELNFDIQEPADVQQTLLEKIEDTTDGAMAPFLDEYSKMQQALKKSHESEARFVSKCRALMLSIKEIDSKRDAQHLVISENQSTRDSLQTQVDDQESHKLRILAKMQEQRIQASEKRVELSDLNKKAETWAQVLFDEQEALVGSLECELHDVSQKRDYKRAELVKLRDGNSSIWSNIEVLEGECNREKSEIGELQRRIAEIEESCADSNSEKTRLQQRAEELKHDCEQRCLEITRKVERGKKSRQDLAAERTQLKEGMKAASNSSSILSRLHDTAQELEDKYNDQQERTSEVFAFIDVQERAIASEEATMADCEKEAKKKRALLKRLRARLTKAEDELSESMATKKTLQRNLEHHRGEVKSAIASASATSKAFDIAAREREVISHDHATKVDSVAAHRIALNMAENTSRNMEAELRVFNATIQSCKVVIEQVMQDSDSYRDELEHKQTRIKKWLERSATKDIQVIALQRCIVEQEARRRQQHNLLEAVRSDRCTYSKTLLEQRLEMGEFKRVFDSLQHAIAHSQQDLNDKENEFIKEHLNVERVDEEITVIEQRQRAVSVRYQSAMQRCKAAAAQCTRLKGVIDEADEELSAQCKQYAAVAAEERVLANQLVKRNAELSALYEHIRLQHSSMAAGETKYSEKRAEYASLVVARNQLQIKLESVVFEQQESTRFKESIADIEKMLAQERLRVRALHDELKKPINVHRWRRLQDTNADRFGMIRQVTSLQKKIITRSDKLQEREYDIENKEKLYVDLRRVLARQPGEEAQEQMRIYQAALKEKKSKHREMRAELKMYQAKVYELKYEIEKVYASIELSKVAYFQRRRADVNAAAASHVKNNELTLKQNYINTTVSDIESFTNDDCERDIDFDNMSDEIKNIAQHKNELFEMNGDLLRIHHEVNEEITLDPVDVVKGNVDDEDILNKQDLSSPIE